MKELKESQSHNGHKNPGRAELVLQDLRVMLVEDCPDQGRLFLKFLQLEGADVTLECTGQSAVDTVRKTPSLFDVIVMDFQLPQLDGLDATREIRALGYEGAILAVTAFGSEDLKLVWMHTGCNAFLEKPIERTEFIQAVCDCGKLSHGDHAVATLVEGE